MSFSYDFSNGNKKMIYFPEAGDILDANTWGILMSHQDISCVVPMNIEQTPNGGVLVFYLDGLTNYIAWKDYASQSAQKKADKVKKDALALLTSLQIPDVEIFSQDNYCYVDDRSGNVKIVVFPVKKVTMTDNEAAYTENRQEEKDANPAAVSENQEHSYGAVAEPEPDDESDYQGADGSRHPWRQNYETSNSYMDRQNEDSTDRTGQGQNAWQSLDNGSGEQGWQNWKNTQRQENIAEQNSWQSETGSGGENIWQPKSENAQESGWPSRSDGMTDNTWQSGTGNASGNNWQPRQEPEENSRWQPRQEPEGNNGWRSNQEQEEKSGWQTAAGTVTDDIWHTNREYEENTGWKSATNRQEDDHWQKETEASEKDPWENRQSPFESAPEETDKEIAEERKAEEEDDEEPTIPIKEDGSEPTLDLNREKKAYAVLTRLLTGEVYLIQKEKCRIGRKISETDLQIQNNRTIDLVQCEISRIDGEFYLQDCNSLNGTYYKARKLESNVIIQLDDRCKIGMADEEFLFAVL